MRLVFLRTLLMLGACLLMSNGAQTQTQAPQREEIVLTTYYPVPYGDYRNLRLWPSNTEQTKECNDNVRGTLFYDENTNEAKVCREVSFGTYAWQSLNLWAQSLQGNTIYPNKAELNVGIGKTGEIQPQAGSGDKAHDLKVDIEGYAKANDVWLENPVVGDKRWASQVGSGVIAGLCTQYTMTTYSYPEFLAYGMVPPVASSSYCGLAYGVAICTTGGCGCPTGYSNVQLSSSVIACVKE